MTALRENVQDIHTYGLDVKNRQIFLHSNITGEEDCGVEFRMSINFVKNMNILDNIKNDPITIHMQTLGGDWFSGISIYNTIKSARSKTTIIGYSQVESMGTVIMQAADTRCILPYTHFMCHFGNTNCSGDYQSSQSWAKLDKRNCDTMLDIYSERCSKTGEFFKEKGWDNLQTKNYIKRRLKGGDWYLSPEDSIRYGFCDKVYE